MWSLATISLLLASTVRAEPPSSVPSYPDLRYIIHYRETSPQFFDFLGRSATNFLHWHGPFSGYRGLMPREDLPRTMESVRETVRQAHDRGALIICYIGPCFSYGNEKDQSILFDFWHNRWDTYGDYLGERPADLIDCTQRDAAGVRRPYEYKGSKGYHLCVNSPGVRQYTKGLIRLIVAAGADGSFYDGPYVRGGNCYCRWCREKFREWLGERYSPPVLSRALRVDDPATVEPPTDPSDALWLPWRRFAAWTLWDFMRDTKEYARSLKPDYVMTANYCMWSGEPYGPLRASAENMELWSQVVDVVFDEAQYGAGPRTEDGGKVSNAVDYRYLVAASHGKPVALLKTTPEVESAEAQANLTRLAIGEGAAQGGAWQFHYLDGAAAEAAVEYNTFLAANAEELRGSWPHTNIGLVCSIQQGYLNLPSYPCAVSRALADEHIDHRMLVDEDVAEGAFDGIEAIVLPEVRLLSGRQCEMLKTYARNGGGLVVIGPCGDLDEWGRQRERSLTAELLQLDEGELPDEPRKVGFGSGRAGFVPHVALPPSGNLALTAEQRAGLSALPELVEWAAGDLALRVNAPPSVEATAVYGPGDPPQSVFVHLVNYDVNLAGAVSPAGPIGVRVRIPDGTRVSGVRVFSPDAGPEYELLWHFIRPGPYNCVTIRVPNVHIYSRLKIGLKRADWPSVDGHVRLSLPREAAPGGTVDLRVECSSEAVAERVRPWILPWAWELFRSPEASAPRLRPAAGKTASIGYPVPGTAQPGDVVEVGVCMSGGEPIRQLRDAGWVRIAQP